MAISVLITSDRSLEDAAALRMVGTAVRSVNNIDPSVPRSSPEKNLTRSTNTDAAALFVGVRFRPATMPAGGSGIVRYNLLLLPDGTAFSGIPQGGDLNITRQALSSQSPRRVGVWRRVGNEIKVDWPSRTGAYTQESYTMDGANLLLRGTLLKPVSCPSGAVQLNGTYTSNQSQAIGSELGIPAQAGLYAASQYRFAPTGRVLLRTETAISARSGQSSGAGGSGTENSAFYNLTGCALQIQRGEETRIHTAFFWPSEGENMLVIDGRTFVRE